MKNCEHQLEDRFYQVADPGRFGRDELPREFCEISALAEAHLRADDILLDLGCGKAPLHDVHANWLGVDISLYALQSWADDKRKVCGDMQRLPFPSGSVAMVVSVAALEHAPKPELVLAELDRVLRPGGLVYLAPAWFVRPWASRALQSRGVMRQVNSPPMCS